MNDDAFWIHMTRDEVCRAYADEEGRKYDFTDKDWRWVSEYEYAKHMSDDTLSSWCHDNL